MCLLCSCRGSLRRSEEALRLALNRLQAAEFLYEAILFPELEYTFKHSLTHEVAYGSLLKERRRVLHVRIVEAIEALYPNAGLNRSNGSPTTLCGARCGPKPSHTYAKPVSRQRAARRTARPSHSSSRRLVLFSIFRSRETIEQAIDLRFDLRSSLYPLAELGRILTTFASSEKDGRGAGRPTAVGKGRRLYGPLLLVDG